MQPDNGWVDMFFCRVIFTLWERESSQTRTLWKKSRTESLASKHDVVLIIWAGLFLDIIPTHLLTNSVCFPSRLRLILVFVNISNRIHEQRCVHIFCSQFTRIRFSTLIFMHFFCAQPLEAREQSRYIVKRQKQVSRTWANSSWCCTVSPNLT